MLPVHFVISVAPSSVVSRYPNHAFQGSLWWILNNVICFSIDQLILNVSPLCTKHVVCTLPVLVSIALTKLVLYVRLKFFYRREYEDYSLLGCDVM